MELMLDLPCHLGKQLPIGNGQLPLSTWQRAGKGGPSPMRLTTPWASHLIYVTTLFTYEDLAFPGSPEILLARISGKHVSGMCTC